MRGLFLGCRTAAHAAQFFAEGRRAYSRAMPIFVSVLHMERQRDRLPSITTSKVVGIPTVVDTCSAAPMSDMFRTVHSIFGPLSLRIIRAVLSARLRDFFLRSGDSITRPAARRLLKSQGLNDEIDAGKKYER